ncbi:MAG: DNA gyrase, A subunit [uncultured bacterium (gcode 4)]|uniref:DNA topoisomerase (ATP-hydrolyzing) n=1 Tax=uncultured bacterium (gcode 4) TaxID=1234023 RepID=K2FZ82_9BACT|nr:MAG: DNA gyrase, A subunit [uncultured bacterium (gcode 4)]
MSENLDPEVSELFPEESEKTPTDTSSTTSAVSYIWDQDKSIVTEMETCYIDYAMSVICQRALPDIRDWLKPVHRRILYAMHEGSLKASGKHRKSARVVWDVLGKYHPHGDTSVYDAMVRMAQYFSMRYPLVDWQGNFGSMDWDGAAAMRYTEVKMTRLTEYLLADIDKDTVDWRDNYDASTQEPTVLPTRLPNLLLNWVMGIAVGMATNIPPHNLRELLDAILFIIRHPNPSEITVEDLMDFIKWPDFPTGWIIYNKKDILNAYATWRWSVILRWKATIDELKNGKRVIIITEVPYQLNKSNFVIKIADLVRDKIIVWISDIRDESNKEDVRVVIELKKDAFPKKILNQLYKLTPLQTSFWFNMIALHERGIQPKLFNLLEILEEFIEHRREVVTRRTKYELWVAEARAHILEWLKIALDNIDAVIATIKASKTREEAHTNLMEKFKLSERQAQAIMEMQLQRLSGLERQKIEDELTEKLLLIADLKDILTKPERVNTIIGTELEEIREKHWDERKTLVNEWAIWEFNPKDTIPNEDIVISLSKNSYIKRMKSSLFRTQRRGWRWVNVAVKDEDEVKFLLSTKNHNDLLFFTNTGRVFSLPAYEIPETQRAAKWQPIINLLSLQKDEDITTILDMNSINGKHFVLITKNAIVKRLDLEDVQNIRSSGLIVMKPKDWDELGWVKVTNWEDNVLIVSKKWKAIQFNEQDVRVMGRAAAWVRWMRMWKDDCVIEADVVSEWDKYVFTVTENWLGKMTDIDGYREQWRWWSWVKVWAMTAKTGDIIWVSLLTEEDKDNWEVLLISKNGQTIRIALKTIRVTSRVTQGVILTKIKWKADVLISATVMKKWEEEDEFPLATEEWDDSQIALTIEE